MISGIVVAGKGEARKLGYPTANIQTASAIDAASGVWACTARMHERNVDAVAVVGMWRESHGGPSLEVHLLDFNQDLYGTTISVELHQHLRDLIPFTTVEDLIEQIQRDIEQTHLCLQALLKEQLRSSQTKNVETSGD